MITFYVDQFKLRDISKSEICIFLGTLASFVIFVNRLLVDKNFIWLLFVLCHFIFPLVLMYINYKTSYSVNHLKSTISKVVNLPFLPIIYSCHFSDIKEVRYEEFTKRFIFIQKKSIFFKFCVHRNEDEVQELIDLIRPSFHSLSFVYVKGIGFRQEIVKEKSFILN